MSIRVWLTVACLLALPAQQAAATVMRLDFSARFAGLDAPPGVSSPGDALNGYFLLDYAAPITLGSPYAAIREGGVVGGAWATAAYSWRFVDGALNTFSLVNDAPGLPADVSPDHVIIRADFVGTDYFGLPPEGVFFGLSGAGLDSLAPPTTLDLDDFSGFSDAYRGIAFAFFAGRDTVLVRYALTDLQLAPVASAVPESPGLPVLAAVAAWFAGWRRRRATVSVSRDSAANLADRDGFTRQHVNSACGARGGDQQSDT